MPIIYILMQISCLVDHICIYQKLFKYFKTPNNNKFVVLIYSKKQYMSVTLQSILNSMMDVSLIISQRHQPIFDIFLKSFYAILNFKQTAKTKSFQPPPEK